MSGGGGVCEREQNGEQSIMDEVPAFVTDQFGVWYIEEIRLILVTKDDLKPPFR